MQWHRCQQGSAGALHVLVGPSFTPSKKDSWCSICFNLLWHFLTLCYLLLPASGAQLDLQGPIFLYEPPRRVEFSNTSGGKVDCQAHGVPLPVLEWILADGTTVTQIKDMRLISGNGSLIFPPFPAEKFRRDVHASVYRCIARNRVGLILSTDVFVKAGEFQIFKIDRHFYYSTVWHL